MIIEPNFLINAREMAEEPLRYRFNTVNLFLALFLESFASKTLIRLLSSGDYPHIKPIPLPAADIEDRIRGAFEPTLAHAVFAYRPTSDCAGYQDWLKRYAPDGITSDEFGRFLIFCDVAIARWNTRRKVETQTILGVRGVALVAAWTVRLLVIASVFLRGFHYVEMSLVIVAMLLAGVACKSKLGLT